MASSVRTPEPDGAVMWGYLGWSVLIVLVGTFVWSVAYGLVWHWAGGLGPLNGAGKAEFTGFDLGLYASYGCLFGFVIGLRAPRQGWIYALAVAIAYAVLFFRFFLVAPGTHLVYAIACVGLAGGFGWIGSNLADRKASRTGK